MEPCEQRTGFGPLLVAQRKGSVMALHPAAALASYQAFTRGETAARPRSCAARPCIAGRSA